MRREEIESASGGLIPLQYIESVGTAWINTGFTPNQNTRVVCEFMITVLPPEWAGGTSDATVVSIPFGSRYTWGNKMFLANIPANRSNARILSYGVNYEIYNDSSQVNVLFKLDANKNTWTIYKNNSIVATKYFSSSTFTCAFPLVLFNTFSHDTISGQTTDDILGPSTGQIRMYSCDIYDNGTQVRQYKPYLNAGEAGMLDEINNVWYGNSGTGNFLYEETQQGLIRLNYLESSGASANDYQYINTGVTTSNTEFEIGLKVLDNAGQGHCFFGGRVGATNNDMSLMWTPNDNINPLRFIYYSTVYYLPFQKNIFKTIKFKDGKLYIDDQLINNISRRSFGNPRNIYLFAMNSNGSAAWSPCAISYCKLWQNGTLVRDYLPYLNNGVPCMYDIVNNTFYYNQGNGQFLYN